MPELLECLEPDLYGGLAREEYLLEGLETPVLFLWRGSPGLVIGKNQNPWKESNLSVLRDKGLKLARRISGGGAVVHDPGNLNISWIVDRVSYHAESLHEILRSALAELGLLSQTAHTGALFVEGKKVSGSAYCYRRDRVLHHSTLLVNADLDILRAALSAPRLHLKSHAIGSLPAQVANLVDFIPGLSVDQVVDAVKNTARKRIEGEWRPLKISSEDARENETRRRMEDSSWIWDHTPRFRGEITLGKDVLTFQVCKGRVEELLWNETSVAGAKGKSFDASFPSAVAGMLGMDEENLINTFAEQGWLWPGSRRLTEFGAYGSANLRMGRGEGGLLG